MAGVDSKLVLNRVSISVDLPIPVSPGQVSVKSLFNSAPLKDLIDVFARRREQVPLYMAIKNGELLYRCCPQHLRMGTERKKDTKRQRKKAIKDELTWKEQSGHEIKRSSYKLRPPTIRSSGLNYLTNQ